MTNEIRADEIPAEIAEKIAWLETCDAALDERGITVLDEVFPWIMRLYYGRVLRGLAWWGVPEDPAEDVLQIVFTALHQRVKKRGAKDGIRRMIGKITKGKALNYHRDRKHVPETTPLPESGSALPESVVDVDRALDLRELERRFVPRLPPKLQAVVRKCTLEGLTEAEAAAALGIPEGTVKSRLRRALEILHALGARWMPASQREAA